MELLGRETRAYLLSVLGSLHELVHFSIVSPWPTLCWKTEYLSEADATVKTLESSLCPGFAVFTV